MMGTRCSFQKYGPGSPEGLSRANDRTSVAGILHAVEDHDECFPAQKLIKAPFGGTHQRDHTLCGLGGREIAKDAVANRNDARALQAAHMRRDSVFDGFGYDHGMDLASRGERFLEQMKTFRDRESAIGQGSARDGFSNFLEQRIFLAGERFHHVSSTTMLA